LEVWRDFQTGKTAVGKPQFTTIPPLIHHQKTTFKHALFPKPLAKPYKSSSKKITRDGTRKSSCPPASESDEKVTADTILQRVLQYFHVLRNQSELRDSNAMKLKPYPHDAGNRGQTWNRKND
jgi:hypothetical protein